MNETAICVRHLLKWNFNCFIPTEKLIPYPCKAISQASIPSVLAMIYIRFNILNITHITPKSTELQN